MKHDFIFILILWTITCISCGVLWGNVMADKMNTQVAVFSGIICGSCSIGLIIVLMFGLI